jgi:hypothetical protein
MASIGLRSRASIFKTVSWVFGCRREAMRPETEGWPRVPQCVGDIGGPARQNRAVFQRQCKGAIARTWRIRDVGVKIDRTADLVDDRSAF